MTQVTLRIEASTSTDQYSRFHGRTIDRELLPDFWVSQQDAIIGTTRLTFTWEETIDLPEGPHAIIYGNSAQPESVPGTGSWHTRIYLNGELFAEGDVNRLQFLRADFTISVPPDGDGEGIPVIVPILAVGGILGLIGLALAARKR